MLLKLMIRSEGFQSRSRRLTVLAVALSTQVTGFAAGGFSGAFAITDATNPAQEYGFFSPPTGAKLGAWTWSLSPGGIIDTGGAPDSISLGAIPQGVRAAARGGVSPMGATLGTAEASISILSPAAGMFSFDYSFEVGELEVFTTSGGL